VGVEGLTYAGCQGLKIIHPDGQRYIHHVEQEYKDRLQKLEEDLKSTVERNGAWVEPKDLLVRSFNKFVNGSGAIDKKVLNQLSACLGSLGYI